jgi:hypothetical protein
MGNSLDARALGQPGGFFDSLTNALAHSVDGYANAQDKRGERDYRLALRNMDQKNQRYRDAMMLAGHGVDLGDGGGDLDPGQVSGLGMLARQVQDKERQTQSNWQAERDATNQLHLQQSADANERYGIQEAREQRRENLDNQRFQQWRDATAMRSNDAGEKVRSGEKSRALKLAHEAALKGALIPGQGIMAKPTFDQAKYSALMQQATKEIESRYASPGADLGRLLSMPDGDGADGEGAADVDIGAVAPPAASGPTHTSKYPDGEFTWYNPNDLLRAVRNAPDTYTVPGADPKAPQPVEPPLGAEVSPQDLKAWVTTMGDPENQARANSVKKLRRWSRGIGEDGKTNPNLVKRYETIRAALESAHKSNGK